jgi:serine/threonine-protein kinase
MRVVVAEDVMLTREGIVHVLERAGVDVIAQVGDPGSLLRVVRTQDPDAAVIDIRMPPTHSDEGIVAARQIRDADPEVAVLVLSQFLESEYAMEVLEDQPERTGYLLKERVFDGAVLVDALNRIVEGETVVDPTIVTRLLGRRRPADPLDELSPREREVLSLVAEGLSNRGIAERLYVTERTVEAHVSQVFLKLGLDGSPSSHRRVLAALAFLRS